MKNISFSICYGLLLLLSFNTASLASDITISGSAYFKCNFRSAYVEKHGYYFIEETLYKKNIKTNLFAAKDAKVIIKNKQNAIVGVGKTDKKGAFSVSVPMENSYQIVIRFHDREIEDIVSYPDAQNFIADLGYFSTEKVGYWIDSELKQIIGQAALSDTLKEVRLEPRPDY